MAKSSRACFVAALAYLFGAISILGTATPVVASESSVTARTEFGPVVGKAAAGYSVFMGIPYAAPPVGELRWQLPQSPAAWSIPRAASRAAARCPQTAALPGTVEGLNEDCLYLNIYAPSAHATRKLRPVMVWIHGGGFIGGAGDSYDAHRLAVGGDVLVVTINYRLGIFGFFGYPALNGSGTFGLHDQLLALRWVRHNAAAFGGDPENVTVFGESAGGMSVCALLTSPLSEGLFERAIVQSGSCNLRWVKNIWFPSESDATPYVPRAEMERRGVQAAGELGCTDPLTALACLRRASVAELIKKTIFFAQIAFDTAALPVDPALAMREGTFHRVPVMSGNTRDEHRSMALGHHRQHPITPQRYSELLHASFDERAKEVAARYPLVAYDAPALAWSAVGTDVSWACPTLLNNRLLAKRVPTYAYEFADRNAPSPGYKVPSDIPLGAAHATELAYLFDFDQPVQALTSEQQQLANRMIQYWARFAANGDPNGPGLPQWPRFEDVRSTPQVQSFAPGNGGVTQIDTSAEHHCAFWLGAE